VKLEFTKTQWENQPSTATPITAEQLNRMETGIGDCANAINNFISIEYFYSEGSYYSPTHYYITRTPLSGSLSGHSEDNLSVLFNIFGNSTLSRISDTELRVDIPVDFYGPRLSMYNIYGSVQTLGIWGSSSDNISRNLSVIDWKFNPNAQSTAKGVLSIIVTVPPSSENSHLFNENWWNTVSEYALVSFDIKLFANSSIG
jgi:hypothetical protein